MKISRDWLQTYFDEPLPEVQELARALTFHAFEIESVENDILDVKVTPNRGHDCLSHRGIARELSAILDTPLAESKYGHGVSIFKKSEEMSVTIENPELCPRYVAGCIKGVKVGPSPEWLVKRLHAMGQQSINNIVDATNFVMFDMGQPLHAFDAGKLRKNIKDGPLYSISVRDARKGEKMVALDKKEYTLNESNLVIADGHANDVIGIAGVKGGMASGIDVSTTDLIIESANFNGVSVRRTARALNLRTDASQRFEQLISPEIASEGMNAACDLIVQIAGGEVVGFVDKYPRPQVRKSVSISIDHINQLLGSSFSESEVVTVFKRLGLPAEYKGPSFIISVPPERLDLEVPEDLIEEVGRIIGYDAVKPLELPPLSVTSAVNQNFAGSERVREDLVGKGYSEVITSVFAERGERAVSNKIGGDKPYLRATLLNGLQEALQKNIYQKDLLALKEVKLFEIGTVWRGGEEIVMVGTVEEKGEPSERPLREHLLPGEHYQAYPLSRAERYEPFSKYPYIVRDVAFWTPLESLRPLTGQARLESDAEWEVLIRQAAGEILQRIDRFDRFEKKGRVSLAYRLVFQSFDRTLSDEDANMRMESVYQSLKSRDCEIR